MFLKNQFFYIFWIVLMHFGMKNTLKSNRHHTPEQALRQVYNLRFGIGELDENFDFFIKIKFNSKFFIKK